MRKTYSLLLILSCLFLQTDIMAQAATACTATAIATGNSAILTDAGTTAGAYGGTPSCGAYNDANGCVNGWYSYTNTSSTPITLDIDATSILGTDRDVTLVIYTSSDGTCTGTFAEQDCENEGADGDATIDVSATVGVGETVWIRMFDLGCNADVQINITAINEIAITNFSFADVDGQTIALDCSNKSTAQYRLWDDGTNANDYSNLNGMETVTFTADLGCEIWIKEIGGPATLICPATSSTASDCGNSDTNDYLKIYDGANLVRNVIGISSSVNYRFGNYKTTSGSLTLTWEAGAFGINDGFVLDIYCVPAPTTNTTVTVPCGGSTTFTDGATNYSNDGHEIWTFCPDAGCSDVICIDLGTTDFEEYFDALYVFDGNSTSAPLHSIFQGANNSSSGRLRAMPSNASGCLTFMLISDAGVNGTGWNSTVTTCPAIGMNGAEECSTATNISAGGTFHSNTFAATGAPNVTDPSISNGNPVTDGTCDPTGTPSSDITQLESTIWYTFTTPANICNTDPVSLNVSNVSCIVDGASASSVGSQFVLYETSSCQAPAAWQATQFYCADIITNNSGADFSSVAFSPSTTYYLMVDAFAGRNCELDLELAITIDDGAGGCAPLPVELTRFYAYDEDCKVFLNWETVSETGASHFDVLKSTDGYDYERIGTIQAKGESTETLRYNFVDNKPSSTNYYQLRQVDKDGTEAYFDKLIVEPKSCQKRSVILRMFPNPVRENLSIELNSINDTKAQIVIFDMTGKTHFNGNYNLLEGRQLLSVPTSTLANGIYSVRIMTQDGQFLGTERLVKH
ncbi:MAG: T9SS type A sorting domain-containing protein [Saprospiraceae bacterium]